MRRRLLAFLIGVLLVPLLLVSAGPGLARALAGAAPHVCRCDAAHTDCVCVVCHPELEEEDRDTSARPLARGTCGDRDVAFVAWHVAGVLPASASAIAPAPRALLGQPASNRLASHPLAPPEPPPPRA